MKVPLLDLTAQHETIKDEILPAVTACFETQQFINGPQVAEFEKAMTEYCDCASAVGVSSGTDALLCSLMVLGIGQGIPACRTGRKCKGTEEVITTPFTFFATAGSIWRSGATPVFVDIEPDTFNIDPAHVKEAISPRTRAIMPVHLFGQTAEMDPINEIAEKHDLFVIEDAAQAIGATYKGRKAGTMGTLGCFSFFPSKNLGGLGDGGMVISGDTELMQWLQQCRNHGMEPQYIHQWVGGNFRLDTIQAAGLLVKLKYLDEWSVARRENAAVYNKLFADTEQVVTPAVRNYNTSIFNQYVIRVSQRDELQAFLRENEIGSAIYYPRCLHLQDCFAGLEYEEGDFPVAEQAAREVIALPIYPELTEDQLEFVASKVIEFVNK